MFARQLANGIELRLVEDCHVKEVFRLVDRNRDHLRSWMPWVHDGYSLNDARNWQRQSLEQFARNDGFNAGVFLEGKLVGVIGFHAISWPNRRTTIGYWLSAEVQGRGVMTAACRALVEHAFGDLGLNRVEIRCAVGNVRSQRIPERLGFTQEGVIRDAEWLHDRFVDHVVYGMLAREWPAPEILARRASE